MAGLATGVFFGEAVAFLDWPARAFVQLLQVTVLPYIVTSLVSGIARRTPEQARRLATRGGAILLALWALSLLLVFLSPLALPPEKGGSFYATAIASGEARIDWLTLYIPSNPFYSLSNNVVPAVVLFSILLGVALLGIPGKERVLGPLSIVNDMLARAGSLLVRLTPIGLFAIAGHVAGTMRVEEFAKLQAFLLTYIGLTLILIFWVLPGLVTALTGLPYRRVLSIVLDPLLTAFVTANLFIVLPLIQERGRQLLAEAGLGSDEAGEAVDVLVSTSFTFPQSAKLLSLAFILFAGWFAGAPVAVHQFPALASAGVLSLFGSLNSAIPFLLDLMRLPADLFRLFLVSSVLNSRFGSAVAVMHTLALAVIGAYALAGQVRLRPARLLRFAGVTAIVVGAFLAASRLVLASVLPGAEASATALDRLKVTGAWDRLAPLDEPGNTGAATGAPAEKGRRLDTIKARGSLRVCVAPDALPWCYRNQRDDLVGFEVDLAHVLAVELQVRLALVPINRADRGAALQGGTCDVTTGRVIPSEAMSVTYSQPITREAWAFLVPDYRRETFANSARLREEPRLRLAVYQAPEWAARLKSLLPQAEVTGIASIQEFIDAPAGRFDAMYTGFDRASAFSLLYPQFSAVVPEPGGGSEPVVLMVPRGEEELLDLVSAVLEVARSSGVLERKLDYWVHGLGAREEAGPRWSVARDVLGWWKN